MDKNNSSIILLEPVQRTSKNVKQIAKTVYSVATGKYEAPAQCCERTYKDFLSSNISVFNSSYHFDWYLFPCHCETTKRLNFDPLENTHDAVFFLQFCRFFQGGPKYSEGQIGSAPDIRMAICKKAIDQWFNPKYHETYWIRLLKILQHLDYTLRSLIILETPEAYQYFVFILKEICFPYFKDNDNDRYQDLYTYDINFHQNIAFFNYLSMEYVSVKTSSDPKISDEKEILIKVYQNIVSNIKDAKGNLQKDVFSLIKNSTNGKYILDISDNKKKNLEKAKNIKKQNHKSTDLKKLEEKENKETEKNNVVENKFKDDAKTKNNTETTNFKDSEINKDTNDKNIENDIKNSSTEEQHIIKKIDSGGNKQKQTWSKYFWGILKFLSGVIMVIAIIWPVSKVWVFLKLNIIFVVVPTPLLIISGVLLLILASHMQDRLHAKPEFVQQQPEQIDLNNILEHAVNYSKNKNQIQLENNFDQQRY